jgi:hypothetical protein
MVYLLTIVIFHGELLNNQMVYDSDMSPTLFYIPEWVVVHSISWFICLSQEIWHLFFFQFPKVT